MTLGDLKGSGGHDAGGSIGDESDEDEKQDMFAGGEKSYGTTPEEHLGYTLTRFLPRGLAIENPGKPTVKDDLVKEILKQAEA